MSFEHWITAFAGRVLSARTFQLIVEPALADLQFEYSAGPLRRSANRFAVLRAVAGGLRDDLARDSASFFTLLLLPTGYYIFMMIICFDVFSMSISTGFFVVAMLILVLSFGPVMVCFWPERQTARSVD